MYPPGRHLPGRSFDRSIEHTPGPTVGTVFSKYCEFQTSVRDWLPVPDGGAPPGSSAQLLLAAGVPPHKYARPGSIGVMYNCLC